MASAWITTRALSGGGKRYRVEFQLGGRGSRTRYGGSFKTKAEATVRRQWIAGELAALRVPDLTLLREATPAPTLRTVAERWKESRVDVAEQTAIFHRTSLNRAFDVLGGRRVDTITVDDIVELVATLNGAGRKRGTIAKTLQSLAMVLDFAGVDPNPARDRVKVRLPGRRGRSRSRRRRRTSKPSTGHCRSSTVCRCCSSTGPAPGSPQSTRP